MFYEQGFSSRHEHYFKLGSHALRIASTLPTTAPCFKTTDLFAPQGISNNSPIDLARKRMKSSTRLDRLRSLESNQPFSIQ